MTFLVLVTSCCLNVRFGRFYVQITAPYATHLVRLRHCFLALLCDITIVNSCHHVILSKITLCIFWGIHCNVVIILCRPTYCMTYFSVLCLQCCLEWRVAHCVVGGRHSWKLLQWCTLKLVIQARSQIEAGSPIQAGSCLGATWWYQLDGWYPMTPLVTSL